MPAIIPFIPLIASVAGPLLSKAIGGGSSSGGSTSAAAPTATQTAQKLFTNPADITKAVDNYRNQVTAKWNQIGANMGSAPDLSGAIDSQAEAMAAALGGLNTGSGYQANNITGAIQGLEPSISAQYPLY